MRHTKRTPAFWALLATAVAIAIITVGCICFFVARNAAKKTYGFHREVSEPEKIIRMQLVETAQQWLGANEDDGTHQEIIDLYNGHEPLAQGYTVKYDDQWCATFVSASAIQAGLTDIIPTECGCQRQIDLFRELDTWEEDDSYIPLPGDIIYYSRSNTDAINDCTGWSDHVGIVVGTSGPFIKVIEGNKDDQVDMRIIFRYHPEIRGYGLPDFQSKTA